MGKPSKKADFTAVGELIGRVAGRVLDHPRSKGQKLRREWRWAAGSQVARHSEPDRLQNGTLTVRVDSSVWMNQLVHLQPRILARLQERLPPDVLRGLRFKQARLRGNPLGGLGPKPPPSPLPPPLPEEERLVQERVAAVTDPDLKKALASLFRTHLIRKRVDSQS